ncbi:VWA domain-containing protein [Aciduricibacillus chroicocephali]|uniref:VWA domain-containing protein n=1 Tax=Aciduricibacillus chroicocephali TaxID=3054939 RepID=A0ABY9KYK9_9BACI|nr:VWA domain-containing protein [Bacillaceae bacterium 44XB]
MKKGTLKQILLITDGCSNTGEDPKATAALASQQGLTINVIGIMEDGRDNPESLREVEEIALAGGGMSRIVYQETLARTVQMVTRQAMTHTIQGFINKELEQILGKGQTVEDLAPEKRGEVMEVVEEMGETCGLEVLVLVDTSASMRNKLETVKDSLIDLSISLGSRIGENRFSIYQFPGECEEVEKIFDWSPNLNAIAEIFPKLKTGGITPTGPAIREAMYEFGKLSLSRNVRDDAWRIEEA